MEEEKNNLVYDRYIVPVGLHYYGVTDNLKKRISNGYETTALQEYIDDYGWDNISTIIVTDGLTRQEALKLEDKLIREGWKRGDCINQRGSGGERRDNPAEYYKQYYKEHRDERLECKKRYNETHRNERLEYQKQYNKQRLSTPAGKIYNRVNNYNRHHPDQMKETPLEARQKYLEWGYIPTYIKNIDLQ